MISASEYERTMRAMHRMAPGTMSGESRVASPAAPPIPVGRKRSPMFDPDWRVGYYQNEIDPISGLGLLPFYHDVGGIPPYPGQEIPNGSPGDGLFVCILSERKPEWDPDIGVYIEPPIIASVTTYDDPGFPTDMTLVSYPEAPSAANNPGTLVVAHGLRTSETFSMYAAWGSIAEQAGPTAWIIGNIPAAYYTSWAEDQSDQPASPTDVNIVSTAGSVYAGAMFGDADNISISGTGAFTSRTSGYTTPTPILNAKLIAWMTVGTHNVTIHSDNGIYGWALWATP